MSFAGLDPHFVLTGVGRNLGRGAYARVLEVEHKGKKYAGKLIHHAVFLPDFGGDYMRRLFEQECRLLSQFHHPNIVQFVGIYFQQGEQSPILLMELLNTNLDKCITQHGILPKEISYSILHDVALGLHYLHSSHHASRSYCSQYSSYL